MAAKSRVKRSLKTRVKRGAKTPARKTRGAKPVASKKAAVKKAAAKRRVKQPASESRIVETALAAFAHEVRTPLTGILAISSLLATSELGERERRWVDTIKVGAEHLAALATLFVDAARHDTTGLAVRQDFFDLQALSRAMGDSLAGRAAAKGLQSQVEIAAKLPVFVTGDPVRLRAALENLIDNAVKFTQQGTVALDVSARAGSGDRLDVTFSVSDSGIGLSLAEIKRLFKPFSQANVSIASRFGGAGLGLSSVKQLARAMGGDITASQRAGGGMTFVLTVALKRAKALKPPAPGSDVPRASRGLRILSIEDNPFGRVVLNAILTELGHQTEFIGRGEAAPERIAQGDFDAVLMDMVLPGIDGVEAIRRVRALEGRCGRIAIIGVSGRADDEQASLAAGADAFLTKPVSPRALATALLQATQRSAT
ncbi:MAG: CheY-like chemotaxis protein [Afipia broomeae]|jgi:CheY-like chemotaxis protein|uniref:ATP-binding protein n=1 Tax=unclassified Afipia TaxID=2642050 RepID=UPI00046571BF|nr:MULTISPECIES: ATP-binding protein [unclassified Afipia]MAH67842.1 hybrid sensor histidine kinase/response regulator [Afipia sp.]OUX63051.1 MAG: hybrid sensor histidine kinase/response regulator [Afipia sp. TMED4]RTL83965.1 MAG: response regulator [Bradyrhizobiaceae bacterium]HAP09738.1 hybrid sensor histidine kinase/response regulator [Afipia sp.]HAP48853.1 hybrid sensor histidine kinase/response regulator [Afipia sp.]